MHILKMNNIEGEEHPCRARGEFKGWINEPDGQKRCRVCGKIITEQKTLDAIDWLRSNMAKPSTYL